MLVGICVALVLVLSVCVVAITATLIALSTSMDMISRMAALLDALANVVMLKTQQLGHHRLARHRGRPGHPEYRAADYSSDSDDDDDNDGSMAMIKLHQVAPAVRGRGCRRSCPH